MTSASPTTPPTTPPAIAPMWFGTGVGVGLMDEVDAGALEAVEDVVSGVEEADEGGDGDDDGDVVLVVVL